MRKSVLMIAFHYPPTGMSSGIQRTLAFSRYLLNFGWTPIVLTVSPLAYERTNEGQLQDIPQGIIVERAFGLDVAKHFTLGGRYFDWMALPDRWNTWWFGAVWAGRRLIREHQPDVIWSTYPIATAHCIASSLSRTSGLPWVADFRDSMVDDVFPVPGLRRRLFEKIEARTLKQANTVVLTTLGTKRLYQERYPELDAAKLKVIQNGYDESTFFSVEQALAPRNSYGPKILVHSGLLYSSERNPDCFFRALGALLASDKISADKLQIVLRASGEEERHQKLIDSLGIQGIVKLAPPIPYREALNEMLQADGLLLFQAANCDHQIPAKVYEYFRAGKPIFAMLGMQGDTAKLLMEDGVSFCVSLDSEEEITNEFTRYMEGLHSRGIDVPGEGVVRSHSRYSRARELAEVLDSIAI